MTYYTHEETPEGHLFRRVAEVGAPSVPDDPAPTPTPTVIPVGVRVIDRAESSVTRIGQTLWKPGQIVAVRCRSGAVAQLGFVEARGFSGTGVGVPFSMSISTSAGDFSGPANTWDHGIDILKVMYGPEHATVPLSSIVYVNVRFDGPVAINEPQSNLGINIGGTFLLKP